MSKNVVLQVIGMLTVLSAMALPFTPWATELPDTILQVYGLCAYGGMNLVVSSTKARADILPTSFKDYCLSDPIFHALSLAVLLYITVPMTMSGLWLRPSLVNTAWLIALVLPYWLAVKLCRD